MKGDHSRLSHHCHPTGVYLYQLQIGTWVRAPRAHIYVNSFFRILHLCEHYLTVNETFFSNFVLFTSAPQLEISKIVMSAFSN